MTGTHSTSVVRFLQTAVILDDEAYLSQDVQEQFVEAASLGGETIEEFVADLAQQGAVDEEPSDTEMIGDEGDALELVTAPKALFTEAVVEAFADFGIACAVLRPAATGGDVRDHNRLRALARRADIVVLDWQISAGEEMQSGNGLRSSDGTSLSFLRELLLEDQKEGQRFRLVCIYTGDPALSKILDRVAAAVTALSRDAVQVDDEALTITSGSLRILVVAKKRAHSSVSEVAVRAGELPALMVKEFQNLVSTGLLPEIALSALSAVRDRAHHLLRRFDSELDPALISHFYRTSADATSEFIHGILADELRSILTVPGTADLLDPEAMSARISNTLDACGPPYFVATKKNGVTQYELTREQANHVLGKFVGPGKFNLPPSGKELDPPSFTSMLLPVTDWTKLRARSLVIDQRFSVLSCMSRTPSTTGVDHPPVLQLGSVLVSESLEPAPPHHEGENSPAWLTQHTFWLCLQPVCDSVRLGSSTAFPLIPLNADHSEGADLIVEFKDKMIGLTTYGIKFNQIVMPTFRPESSSQTVTARLKTTDQSAEWVFLDNSGKSYSWIGQVRQWKAQKLVGGVANRASRIGLDEYEFLRRQGPRNDA